MRETLTILAAVVVALLAAALALPPLIDWTAHADALASRIGAAIGARTTIAGPVSLRLLPAPRLEVGRFQAIREGLRIEGEAAQFELAPAPLLRGVFTLTSATLDRARVTIDAAAKISAADLPDVTVDRIALRDATFVLDDHGAKRTLARVDVTASADSLRGPFKAEGFFRRAERLIPFRIATGAIQGDTLSIKATIEPLTGLPTIEAAGAVGWKAGPSFAGTLQVTGEVPQAMRGSNAPLPWDVRAKSVGDLARLDLNDVEVRAGDDAARIVARGTGTLSAEGLRLSLGADHPDLDRFSARYAFDAIRRYASRATDQRFAIDVSAAELIAGGAILTNARVALSSSDDTPKLSLSADLGQSHASFEGALSSLDPVAARGHLAVKSGDVSAAARWLAAVSGAADVQTIPAERLDATAELAIAPDQIAATNIHAQLDRSMFAGSIAWRASTGAQAAQVTADLTAPSLDIDALPDLAGLRSATKGIDLALNFDARAFRVASVGRGSIDAGRIALSLKRQRDNITLDNVRLDGIGGASATAHGQIDANGSTFDLTLDARKLDDLAVLARRIAPDWISEAIRRRASAFSPAAGNLQLRTRVSDGHDSLTQIALKAKGGDTAVSADLAPDESSRTLAGKLALDAPEAATLLRQFGFSVLPLRGQGDAHVEATLSGPIGKLLATRATARLAGVMLAFDGEAQLDVASPHLTGEITAKAADAAPLMRILAMPLADPLGRRPVEGSAKLDLDGDRFTLASIAAAIGGLKASGSLQRESGKPITGALHVDRLDASSLASLLLGVAQPVSAGQVLSSLKFAAQPNDPPDLSVDLTADRFGLLPDYEGSALRARLETGPGVLSLKNTRMDFAGGVLAGDATLRREGGTATLDATVEAKSLRFNAPWASGVLSGGLAAKGAGPSAAALVGSLAGTGRLHLDDLRIARADRDAATRVAAAVDAEQLAMELAAIASVLARESDRAPQVVGAIKTPLSLEAGRIAASAVDLSSGGTLTGQFDLANAQIELRENFAMAPPKDWLGPLPGLTVLWTGSPDNPARAIDSSDLVRILANHAIAREQARIAAQEADQRERIYFNRRLKFDRKLEADRKAEAARQEAARLEALRQDALRQEAARREKRASEPDEDASPRALVNPPLPPGPRPLNLHPR